MKIFLAGGGGAEDSAGIDEMFFKMLPKKCKVLYVPIAINEKKHPYPECHKWIIDTFSKFGNIKIDLLTDLTKINGSELKQYSAVYIGGGNTFKLLDAFRRTGFDRLLCDFAKNGIVYGGSAGAIILGEDIQTSAHLDKNDAGVSDTSGLGLVKSICVFCHYRPETDNQIIKGLLEKHERILAIPEKSGVFYDGQSLRVVGKEPVAFFSKKNKILINPGKSFKL